MPTSPFTTTAKDEAKPTKAASAAAVIVGTEIGPPAARESGCVIGQASSSKGRGVRGPRAAVHKRSATLWAGAKAMRGADMRRGAPR